MFRYEIDAYGGSGSKALYLLSAIEMARLLSGQAGPPADFESLLAILNDYEPRYAVARRKPDFTNYFGPTAVKDLKNGSAAYEHLFDFMFRQITTIRLNCLSPGLALLRLEHRDDPEKLQKVLRNFLSETKRALTERLSKTPGKARHPRLHWLSANGVASYGLPAYSLASLRLLLCGFSRPHLVENREAGVYYAVRQPRGVLAETPERLAALVRDVLWLRHTNELWHDNERKCFGYYFGALSGDVYEISSVDVVKGGYVHLYGREIKHRSSSSSSQMSMILPPRCDTEQEPHRPALIFGAAGKRESKKLPAAGKVVVLTPPHAWEIAKDLETILSQTVLFKDSGDGPERLGAYVDRVFALLDLLQAKGHVGVISAHAIARNSVEHLDRLLTLRHHLKSLLALDVAPCVDAITKRMFLDLLDADLQARIERMGADPRISGEFNAVLEGILTSWGMLDPLSIVEPESLAGPSGAQGGDCERMHMIEALLEAATVYPSVDAMVRKVAAAEDTFRPAAPDRADHARPDPCARGSGESVG